MKRAVKYSVNVQKKSKLFYFIAFVTFILVLLVSEFLYLYQNRPSIITQYYLARARYKLDRSNYESSLMDLTRASNLNINVVAKKYPKDLIPKSSYPPSNLFENKELKNDYLIFLKSIEVKKYSQSPENLAKLFYDLTLLSIKFGEPIILAAFLQTAIYLNPELSHYHVELANLYLAAGDKEKSQNVLNYCYNFDFPKTHCRQYNDNNFYWNVPEKIGFLKEAVEAHYKNN